MPKYAETHLTLLDLNLVCLAGAVANVADSGRCNPNMPSSISTGGKDFP